MLPNGYIVIYYQLYIYIYIYGYWVYILVDYKFKENSIKKK